MPEREIGRIRDGVVCRGPRVEPPAAKGTERARLLELSVAVLACAPALPDDHRSLAKDYGLDELGIYELVQIAEELWGIQLLPAQIEVASFARAVAPFDSLASIAAAAERASMAAG